ncbi:hypothetical protein RISK_005993 [Rhodopirellula islandica]|uniref:Uncharacterized protein n=1 Tax=Rhodopirellula islandica TaxID=595434 RepID=A0A0J1E8L8_RHOIS|nr:hypothetical protein RISK_005993 [Rhodopirellula islandica]
MIELSTDRCDIHPTIAITMAVSTGPSHIRFGVSRLVVSAAPVSDRNLEIRDWFAEESWLIRESRLSKQKGINQNQC